MTQVKRLERGQLAPAVATSGLDGRDVTVPDTSRVVHLQFRRFAGCPICNLHLRSVARRIDELHEAGVREVAVFHSEAATMRAYQADLPFDVIADPERRLYDAYGVGSSARSVLDPRAWPALVRGMFARHPSSAFVGEGGHMGLPADFLVDREGTIVDCHYGTYADDQWSVDEILTRASEASR